MGLFYFEGFESVGTEVGNANRTTTQARVAKRFTAFGVGINGFLIDDFNAEGYAWASRSPSQLANATLIYHFSDDILAAIARDPETPTFTHVMGFRLHTRGAAATGDVGIWSTVGRQTGGVKSSGGCLNLAVTDGTDLKIRRGSTVLATIVDAFTAESWHYVEIAFKIGDTSGAQTTNGHVRINVDNNNIYDGDLDTDPDILNLDYVGFELQGNSGDADAGDDYWGFDDVYCLHTDGESAPYNDFLGPVRVIRYDVEADSTPLEWTPSSAVDHYTLIDENGADSANYIESDTHEQSDMFAMADFTGQGTIYGLKVEAEAINTVGGTPDLIIKTSNGETVHEVANTASSVVFTHYEDVAGFDDVEIGVEFGNGF